MKIKAARKAAGLTQQQLAELIGCDQSVISRIEQGRRDMSVNLLRSIAQALGVPLQDLIDEEEVA
jgi:transcriptional regulator with XRE-family HTH domain